MATRGRPRTFDRNAALKTAMRMFWEKGYEGATLSDLQTAMGGITPPSLYAAFGSKEELFREAVALYNQMHGASVITALNEGATARESIEGYLRATVRVMTLPREPRGCLVILGGINCMAENSGVQEHLREIRMQGQRFVQQRLKRAVAEGDLPQSTDVSAMAGFYTAVADGLAIQARDGASIQALGNVVDGALAAWNKLTSSARTGSRARKSSR